MTRPTRVAPPARRLLNKVPEVTIFFWIIKLLATTVGETAADFLNDHFGLGLTGTTLVMSVGLAVALWFQFRARRYVPVLYWTAVVLISVVGTLASDNLVDNFGVPLVVTTAAFSFALAVTFAWFGWWGDILRLLGGMEIRINAAGYLCIGVPLFVAWLAVVLVYDRQHYVIFGLGQIRYVVEIGSTHSDWNSARSAAIIAPL